MPKSEIRSARPERTIFANNLIYNSETAQTPIYYYDKVDGVSFKNNVSNNENKTGVATSGLATKSFSMNESSQYLMLPSSRDTDVYNGFDFDKITTDLFGNSRESNNAIGATINPEQTGIALIDKSKYGTTWFSAEKPVYEPTIIKVATADELTRAIQNVASGDIIELTQASYSLAQTVIINKEVVITSADKSNKSVLNFTANGSAFSLKPKSFLHLESVVIRGNSTQHAFATLDKNMSKAYDLSINNSEIYNFNNVLDVSKGSFADIISVTGSVIKNNKNGFVLNKETDNKGTYNAEFVTIKNTVFDNISGAILDYHRGGYDESTIGGSLVFEGNTVTNSGKEQKDSVLMKNRGIVNVSFKNNAFTNNPVKLIAILWGEKGQKPENSKITNSGEVKIVQNLKLDLIY